MIMQNIPVVLVLALALAGCLSETNAGRELEAKSEYSVLQSFEFDYRERKQERNYIIEKNALSSGYDLIGLPKANVDHGYVWLIANPSSEPAIKKMPSDDVFSVNKDALAAIKQSVQLPPAMEAYLAENVERHR
ncbi:hypothetical protein HF319_01885 [Xanthomonas sp. Kuri4-1]